MVVLAVADGRRSGRSTNTSGSEELTDPRKLTEAQARRLIQTGKPFTW
jgi:hypothetical protein